ncbi:MAG: HNH endonuclease [Candidatus Hadarchaeia archaeon]
MDILERHHKVSPKYGRSDKIENYALLCPPCNKKVGAKKKEIKVRNPGDWNNILSRIRREL